jgi:hypothetical protein
MSSISWADRYDMFTQSIQETVPPSIGNLSFNFYAPKRLKIYDPVLGVLEKLLQILVVAYTAVLMVNSRQYLYTEAPQGTPVE